MLVFAHGWPSVNAVRKRYRKRLSFNISKLELAHARNMMGNGIHLAAVAAWHFYIFAHVIRKDVAARLRLPLADYVVAQLNDPDPVTDLELSSPDSEKEDDTLA